MQGPKSFDPRKVFLVSGFDFRHLLRTRPLRLYGPTSLGLVCSPTCALYTLAQIRIKLGARVPKGHVRLANAGFSQRYGVYAFYSFTRLVYVARPCRRPFQFFCSEPLQSARRQLGQRVPRRPVMMGKRRAGQLSSALAPYSLKWLRLAASSGIKLPFATFRDPAYLTPSPWAREQRPLRFTFWRREPTSDQIGHRRRVHSAALS